MDTNWKSALNQAGYPETALILDFESFYSKDYSLKKLSTIEYVCDPRFELLGLGVGTPLGPDIEFLPPDKIKRFLSGVPFLEMTIVGQNLFFDCLILKRHFGITPQYTVDIRDLDRMWDARDKHSLAYMAKKWKAPKPKGKVDQFKGWHWDDMFLEMQIALEEYCKTDVEIESFLFQKLLPLIPNPEIELPLATQTLKLFLEPQILIDKELGAELKQKMLLEMLKPLETLREKGFDYSHEDISGNISFVEILNRELPDNEQVPTKMGKKGLIPALAQEDEGLRYLLGHEKEIVRLLAKARVAIKSWPLHIKRVDNILNQAACSNGKIGAPLSFYAGHLGRWGGTEGINLQNLGGRGRKGSGTHLLVRAVRGMLKAPDGYIFAVPDFSQIELRITAWFAGQNDLVQAFAEGRDVYSEFATEDLFKEPIRKARETDPEPIARMLTFKRGFSKDGMLGFTYGMGTNRFYGDCIANDSLRPFFDSGEYDWDFVDRLIKTLRTRYSKIPEFWRKVEKAWKFVTKYPKEIVELPHELTFCHKNKATFIYLPSGRFIRYPYASVNKQDDLLYRWGGHLWGGAITENIVQACARDVLSEALLRLQNAGYNILFHSHDEVICLLDKSSSDLWLQGMINIMSHVPYWAIGLPISVEGKLCERYEK